MSRWIDADDAIKKYKYYDIPHMYDAVDLEDILNEMPSIDICFCKECRYCKKKRGTFKGEPIIFYRCTENNRDVESDDFCSWGEREGE